VVTKLSTNKLPKRLSPVRYSAVRTIGAIRLTRDSCIGSGMGCAEVFGTSVVQKGRSSGLRRVTTRVPTTERERSALPSPGSFFTLPRNAALRKANEIALFNFGETTVEVVGAAMLLLETLGETGARSVEKLVVFCFFIAFTRFQSESPAEEGEAREELLERVGSDSLTLSLRAS